MQEIKLRRDYGSNQTHEKWNGKFLTGDSYEQVVSPIEDTYFHDLYSIHGEILPTESLLAPFSFLLPHQH